MSELKQRPGDQPLPIPNDGQDIQSMVIADIQERRQVGIQRYGTALQAHNGRDAGRDLYEELLDAVMYQRQHLEERAADRASIEREVRASLAEELHERAAEYADTLTGPRASFRRGMLAVLALLPSLGWTPPNEPADADA